MNTKIENISDTRKKITVAFAPEQVEEEKGKAVADFVRNAKIPGFRPGKAPKAMVEKLYSDAIKDQLERSLTSRAIEEINAIKDFDLYAVVDIKREEKDGGFELEFAADVYPEVKLPESLETKVELEPAEASDADIAKIMSMIRAAKRPVIYAGGGIISSGSSKKLDEFSKILNIPVATTRMGLGCVDPMEPKNLYWFGMHGTYAGNTAVFESDLLIALGTRFDDRITGAVSKFAPDAKIIHLDIDLSEHNKNVKADFSVCAEAGNALSKLISAAKSEARKPDF